MRKCSGDLDLILIAVCKTGNGITACQSQGYSVTNSCVGKVGPCYVIIKNPDPVGMVICPSLVDQVVVNCAEALKAKEESAMTKQMAKSHLKRGIRAIEVGIGRG